MTDNASIQENIEHISNNKQINSMVVTPPEKIKDSKVFSSEKLLEHLLDSVEFGLGLLSNTASYLRLWALSLAHSELSAVFFNMTLGAIIRYGGFFTNFVSV